MKNLNLVYSQLSWWITHTIQSLKNGIFSSSYWPRNVVVYNAFKSKWGLFWNVAWKWAFTRETTFSWQQGVWRIVEEHREEGRESGLRSSDRVGIVFKLHLEQRTETLLLILKAAAACALAVMANKKKGKSRTHIFLSSRPFHTYITHTHIHIVHSRIFHATCCNNDMAFVFAVPGARYCQIHRSRTSDGLAATISTFVAHVLLLHRPHYLYHPRGTYH